jgi:hypothetical protein
MLSYSYTNYGQGYGKGGNGRESGRSHIGMVYNMEGFGLAVDIKVEGIDEELLKAGHKVCLDSW